VCGIAGFFLVQPNPAAGQNLAAMQTCIQHRGPDGSGLYEAAEKGIGLAHTRLAIIDLTNHASQPMQDPVTGITVVFNGEVYNWRDIRSRLEGLGHSFKTQSDTEVILEGYKRWGTDVLDHLRGMFALAVWDEREDILFCARDRVGKKPFVYAQGPKGFVFGSEIPAVLRGLPVAGLTAELDAGAMASMLLHNMRHIPDPATIYKNVRRLRAGHAMIVRGGRVVRSWKYWTPLSSDQPPLSVVQLREVIEEAIELRRVADVPVGALLSGGVDSTAIVALTQARSNQPLRTYAMGMNVDDEDLVRARRMAALIGTEHREFYFDPDKQWQSFGEILSTYGEPIMLLPLVHTLELCKAIRSDGIKVVLSGNGADELFYGYTGMVQTGKLSKYVRTLEPFAPLAKLIPQSLRPRPLTVLGASRGQRKAALYKDYARDLWPAIITTDAVETAQNYAAEEIAYWGQIGPNADYIDESSFAGMMVENTHSITTAADLPPMMAGVEMRAPFLDQNFISAALSFRWTDKIPSDGNVSNLKTVFKRAVADLMPQDILYAPKRGFGMGIQERDVLTGAWREHADASFNARHSVLDGVINQKAASQMWDQAKAGAVVKWDLLAKLFALQTWADLSSKP
jgi:asparagine synthase (glutamine-hydrolysing)